MFKLTLQFVEYNYIICARTYFRPLSYQYFHSILIKAIFFKINKKLVIGLIILILHL
jgi:hypothetical protein